jgi:chromosome segregation protein
MHLNRLELQGFKSFAKKTSLVFPKSSDGRRGITAIVGPNGSGKTNIVDAIRWVLGEQSLKTIRGKKGEDILFAGTAKRPSVGMAEVSLYLENDGQSLPLDWKEVTISRRAFRDGENEYLINKNKVRLQDITLLLAQGQFGQKTYSVIGQGMADAILNASPFERKDFFDDAAGVKQFNIKKEQAISKLEHTKENLAQAEVLLQEIEPRYRSLLRQVKKLERREERQSELRELQKKYFGHLWLSLKEDLSQIEALLGRQNEKVAEKEEEITNLKNQMARLEQEETKQVSNEEHFQKIISLHHALLKMLENQETIATSLIKEKIQEIVAQLEAWRLAPTSSPGEGVLRIFFDLQKEFLKKQDELRTMLEKQQEFSISRARLDTKRDDLIKQITQELSVGQETIENFFLGTEKLKTETEIAELEIAIGRAKDNLEIIGGIDPEIVKEFEQTKTRYEFLKTQSEDLKNAMAATQEIIKELDQKIQEQFASAFQEIQKKFSYFFQNIFSGGQATLELIQEKEEIHELSQALNPEDGEENTDETIKNLENQQNDEPQKDQKIKFGIEIKASPPGKRVKSVASLSGGERALTSLALLYAILAYRPPPFIVLDETDAALDETNSRKTLEILKNLSKDVQCILISHNRATMEQADTLYGVTLGDDGSSHLLSLRLEEAERLERPLETLTK